MVAKSRQDILHCHGSSPSILPRPRNGRQRPPRLIHLLNNLNPSQRMAQFCWI
jgi:hypothetical protein